MAVTDAGIPGLVFAQLLEGQAVGPDEIAHFRALMRRDCIDEAALLQPGKQVPLRWLREVYPRLTTDEATRLGRIFAEHAQLTSFGPLSVPLVSAGSVAELAALLEFLPLISAAIHAHHHPTARGLSIALTADTGDRELDCLVVAYCGFVLLRIMAVLVGAELAAQLELGWAAPADHVPEAQVVYGAPMSVLHVPNETLTYVCRFSDPIAYRLAIAQLRTALDELSSSRTLARRIRLTLDASSEILSCESVADGLALSVSTVKRRLLAEGTSFRELQETSLRERATLQLLDSSRSVSQIARGLGYSDVTNFSHAFKRWTGASPNEFRHAADR